MGISVFSVWGYHKNKKLQFYGNHIAMLEKKAHLLQEGEEKQSHLFEQVHKSNTRYLAEEVEPSLLLSDNLRRIQALYRSYPTNEILQNRLFFLQGEENRIKFIPVQTREGFSLRETEFTLKTPVQMDEANLKKVLSDLEGSKENKPIIIIKKFTLLKNPEEGGGNVYNVYMELIQRSL